MTVPFRVTETSSASNTLDNLQFSLKKLQDLQNVMSTGKTITKPSDDPSGAAKAMQYRSDISRDNQYDRNASDGLGWLGTADNTLTSSLDEIQRVRSLVLEGVNATSDANSRQALADEITTIKQGLVSLANTTYNNRPIFAGTANPNAQTPPVDTYTSTGAYNGNTGAVTRTVGPNASVQVNMAGPSVWGTGSTGLFATLDDIVSKLTSGNPSDIEALSTGTGNSLDALDAGRVNIQNRLSEVGARYHRVETMQTRAQDSVTTTKSSMSDNEDADMASTIISFQLQNSAYQVALSAAAKVIQPSLIDFLK